MSRRRNRADNLDARFLPLLEDDYLPMWIPEKGPRNPNGYSAPRARTAPLPKGINPTIRDNYECTEIHNGDRYTLTQINVYISGNEKKRITDADELYEEILRKRNGGDWR